MWFGPDVVLHDELPESDKGSYEPLYVFEERISNLSLKS